MDVRLPDGTIVRGVPDGMSKADLTAKLSSNGYDVAKLSTQPSLADQIPGGGLAGNRNVGQVEAPTSFMDKVTGGIEAARNVATGMTTGALGYVGGALGGIAGSIASGDFGTERGTRLAKEAAEEGANSLTYQPKTALGQQYSQNVAHAIDSSGIVGVPIPELEALGRSLPITRRVAGPSMDRAAPAVDYDIPTYQRQGITLPSDQLGTPSAAKVEQEVAGPTLPPSSAPATALDAYAAAPTKSPFGDLVEPVIPPIEAPAPVTALDQYAQARASDPKTFGELLKRSNYEPEIGSTIASAPIDSASKSPLDSLIAGEPAPVRAITAGLRDTSDIDSILQNFGVDVPAAAPAASQAIRGPVMPTDTVERATAPMQALDSTLRVPEQAPGPSMPAAAPVEAVERAVEAPKTPFVATQENHVNPENSDYHKQVLQDVGFDWARDSATNGDAALAARQWNMAKATGSTVGELWYNRFARELDGMKTYAQGILDRTGGRVGLNELALKNKGMDLAAPIDALRKYFEDAKTKLYDQADKELGGLPLANTDKIDSLLVDRSFNNAALADKNLDLVKAVNQQLELHKERNGGSLTVKEAEDFRQWLNKRWTRENSNIIGAIKDALDDDVFASAGQDVYADARRMHIFEKETIDDPKGMAKLMDADARTPINRNTAYEKIPDAMMNLPADQFEHIINTYRAMPEELQPLAQKAIDTLKAHYAERMLDAGTETNRGNPRKLWGTGEVATIYNDNSAKIPMVFNADEISQIHKMLEAGEILRVDPSYPGAAAQAINLGETGMMGHAVEKLGGALGGMVGATAGKPGIGYATGKAIAKGVVDKTGERALLLKQKEAVTNFHNPKPAGPTLDPITDWENDHRP